MNFALSTIIVVFLLLPGAIAIRAYYSSLRAKVSNSYVPLSELLFQGILLSFIIHASFICIITKIFKQEINFNFLYKIIVAKEGKDFSFSNQEFTHNLLSFSYYIIICSAISYVVVKIFKFIIHWFKFDYKYNFLRNANYWFDIFNLEIPDEEVDVIMLDVYVKPDIIYSGYLIDFNYSSKKDQLENIVLASATRRKVVNKSEENETPKVSAPVLIPGNRLVLLMDDIINMNIRYLKIDEQPTGNQETNPSQVNQTSP